MGMTLAEIRASRATTLPQRSMELCLSQSLVVEAQQLAEEKAEIAMRSLGPTDDGDATKPGRLGNPDHARLTEVDERLQALFAEMREHTGTIVVQGIESGEWMRWRDAHPARKSDEDNEGRPVFNPVDVAVTQAWCDASALMSDLGRYVVRWNDEPVTSEDWEFIRSKAAPGDLKELCRLVVEMHEGNGVRAPKASLTPSPSTETSATD